LLSPFRNRKPNVKRYEPRRVRGRERLDAAGKRELRLKRYEHAQGKCETCGKEVPLDGPLEVRAHLSHNEHGPRKSDEFHRVTIECFDCHIVEGHQGGKPVRKKPGRPMSKAEAMRYLRLTECFCSGPKNRDLPFCNECKSKLSPQSLLDLAELTNKQWLQAMADAERELMTA
jgi:hypothetical protein